LNNIIDFEFQS